MQHLFVEIILLLRSYATLIFLVSIVKKRNDIADIARGIGYILICGYLLWTQAYTSRLRLVSLLVLIRWTRLALHIYLRNRQRTEDFRYAQRRKEWWSTFYLRSYLQVYLLQAFFLLLIISPIIIISTHSQSALNFLDYIGVLLWCIWFFFEAVGDRQLVQFSKKPTNKGHIMQTGLRKYTRHPNYFGEVTLRWWIGIIALSSPLGGWWLVWPLSISRLILYVSGIPMLEKKYASNQEYISYKQKTSPFLPQPPK